jgi:hypothetical protein
MCCLDTLSSLLGKAKPAAKGNSLYVTELGTTVYIRYSKRHMAGSKAVGFYGLRVLDLRYLQHQIPAAVVFCTDDPEDLIFVPIDKMLIFLEEAHPAQDGSYKMQIAFSETPELSLAGVGRVGLGGYEGVPLLAQRPDATVELEPQRQHILIQSRLRDIGIAHGYNVWVPRSDRGSAIADGYLGDGCLDRLDLTFPRATRPIAETIDVLWLGKQRLRLEAMFEVEHSTTVYSGLLRMNDVIIDCDVPTVSIVSDISRLGTFLRHLGRRTFEVSGLAKVCSHYTYEDVEAWHSRLVRSKPSV